MVKALLNFHFSGENVPLYYYAFFLFTYYFSDEYL